MRRGRRFAALAAVAVSVYAGIAYLFWLPPIRLPASVDLASLPPDACSDPAALVRVAPQTILFVPLSAVPDHLVMDVLQQEDAFYNHRGIDWLEMWRALRKDLTARRYQYGASTLTMQLMRELFLNKQRRLLRKLREMAYALQAERRLSKPEILELYLNVVHWGPGIRGVGAAACYYFGRPPSALTVEQAKMLVSVLPDPDHRGAVLLQRTVPPQGSALQSPWVTRPRRV